MRPRRSRHLRSLGIGAAIAVGASLGVLAPAAMAAPGNDHFEDRASLTGPLPIHVSESNVGATKDPGEPRIGELSSSGHSLWWEWVSPRSGWTTVSVCETDFLADVKVFEGTELEHLRTVTDERTNGGQGPQCWATGTTFTFDATAGKSYVIGVDGNSFYPPPLPGEEPHVPSGEGQIELSIEATPPPSDDDFADPSALGTHFMSMRESPFEEPNEDRYFWEQTIGYNWGATKQAGEPDHAGDPGGASVWYSWTPTESGEARISLQGAGGPKLLALYRGSVLGELVPVASSAGPFSYFTADVIGGTEYRIAVDGSRTEVPGEPFAGAFMGSFDLAINLVLPPLPVSSPVVPTPPVTTSTPQPQAPPTLPTALAVPIVTIAGHQVDSSAGAATFRFRSATKGAKFRCAVDGKSYKACSSPFTEKGLKPGKHVFQVLAGVKGATSARPAVVHFSVPAARRRQHAAG